MALFCHRCCCCCCCLCTLLTQKGLRKFFFFKSSWTTVFQILLTQLYINVQTVYISLIWSFSTWCYYQERNFLFCQSLYWLIICLIWTRCPWVNSMLSQTIPDPLLTHFLGDQQSLGIKTLILEPTSLCSYWVFNSQWVNVIIIIWLWVIDLWVKLPSLVITPFWLPAGEAALSFNNHNAGAAAQWSFLSIWLIILVFLKRIPLCVYRVARHVYIESLHIAVQTSTGGTSPHGLVLFLLYSVTRVPCWYRIYGLYFCVGIDQKRIQKLS